MIEFDSLAVDKNASTPAYKQIIDAILKQIVSGKLPVGSKLPAQRTLSAMFKVNRSTVCAALNELASYGIIKGSYGGGTIVASNTWSMLLKNSANWSNQLLCGEFLENIESIRTINELEFSKDMTRLGTGEIDPRLISSDYLKEAMAHVTDNPKSLGYLEPLGLYELREQLCIHLKKMNINANPMQILITSGSLQALQLISVSLLKQSDRVFIESPSYLKSIQVFPSAGITLQSVPMDSEGIMYWKLLPKLKKSAEIQSVLYTIPDNHNPTGISMSDKRRTELLEFCTKFRLPIIEDGAYSELTYTDTDIRTIKSKDTNDMVIYIGTASKTLCPGLRVGWIVASEPVVSRLSDVKMQMDYGASSISQIIFMNLLKSGNYQRYLNSLRVILKQRLESALACLDRYFSDVATWLKPDGGFYIWLTFRKTVDTQLLFRKAIENGIMLNPGSIYDFSDNNSLRISFSYTSESEFEGGISKLRAVYDSIFAQ
ncbi:MAG: PLP-dependent aminotransferase family protein [Succinivibrio sp.]